MATAQPPGGGSAATQGGGSSRSAAGGGSAQQQRSAASASATAAPNSTTGTSSTAADSLQVLLRDDPLLSRLGLTDPPDWHADDHNAAAAVGSGAGGQSKKGGKDTSNDEDAASDTSSASSEAEIDANDNAAFSYAAALLKATADGPGADGAIGLMGSTTAGGMTDESWSAGGVQKRATEALEEVNRKLALVESLADRIARERPEEVAGPLCRMHGYDIGGGEEKKEEEDGKEGDEAEGAADTTAAAASTSTLTTTLDRIDRLQRQSDVLVSISNRVESTLQRGLRRMDNATSRLERVLDVSSTLKNIMRLRFEAKKVQSCGVDFDVILSGPDPSILAQTSAGGGGSSSGPYGVDLRDLTRAASSVSIMEGLLSHPTLCDASGGAAAGGRIDVVEQMRPEVEAVSAAVRKVAAALLAEYTDPKRAQGDGGGGSSTISPSRLGATLQVYYHLGELPEAAWGAVGAALAQAERVTGRLFNPSAVQRLIESATAEARDAVESGREAGSASSAGSDPSMDKRQRKKQNEAALTRALKRKLREKRAEAAKVWSGGISDAALRVWTLQRVLSRKSDPSSRQNFMDVVSASSVPDKFEKAQRILDQPNPAKVKNFVFALFWNQLCISMGERIDKLLKYNGGSMAADTAALYPALRTAAIDMMGTIQDAMQAGLGVSTAAAAVAAAGGASGIDDGVGGAGSGAGGIGSVGIMGGSAGLDFAWAGDSLFADADDVDDSGLGGTGADAWTRVDDPSSIESNHGGIAGSKTGRPSSAALAGIFSSSEWAALQGSNGGSSSPATSAGLRPLQRAFLEASSERLCAPLRFMFPEAVAVDENGTAIDVLPHLPSRYDLAKIDAGIREELSLADPREGGGELTMVTMISENVVDLVERFCAAARGAASDAGEGGYLHEDDGTATEALLHDMKLCNVMGALATSLRNAPENTFIAPYRPAHSLQHEEAANLCKMSLKPALHEISSLTKTTVLTPLYRALNKRVSTAIAMMHQGTYLEEKMDDGAFVQHHLAQVYDNIASSHLSKLPSEYSSLVASTIATYSIYTFVSNSSLVRPLGENSRLKITQDLADFELCLEQLVVKGGSSASLSQMDGGRPYAELRATRSMLFWNGLESDNMAPPADIAKAILREAWVKDVRPSTVFHFLFSFAPPLLSSPHHSKRMTVEEYVGTLVKFDGSVDDGEAAAWMTTLACCDNYHQRASVGGNVGGGDSRIAAILEALGPELLRRRRH